MDTESVKKQIQEAFDRAKRERLADKELEFIGNIHEPPKDFRPEHLKRMGVSMSKGD